jgi:hypothetical protein
MSITELFSKRQKRRRGEVPDVYQYEELPDALRVQVVHIWRDAYGDYDAYQNEARNAFEFIHNTLCREYGLFKLTDHASNHFEAVMNFFLRADDVETAIDVIELFFRGIDKGVRGRKYQYSGTKLSGDDAIDELNARFREHGVGFQYEAGQIIRVDSQLIHSEVVKPALRLLSAKPYKGANQEFLSAHTHYRAGKYKECLNDCLKAFESTMKAICDKRKWQYKPTDTAKPLLDVVFAQGLVPAFMQNHFTGLPATLEAGVPTVRNKLGGHGQGTTPMTVPESIASYALHLTATTVVFLAKAEAEMK